MTSVGAPTALYGGTRRVRVRQESSGQGVVGLFPQPGVHLRHPLPCAGGVRAGMRARRRFAFSAPRCFLLRPCERAAAQGWECDVRRPDTAPLTGVRAAGRGPRGEVRISPR